MSLVLCTLWDCRSCLTLHPWAWPTGFEYYFTEILEMESLSALIYNVTLEICEGSWLRLWYSCCTASLAPGCCCNSPRPSCVRILRPQRPAPADPAPFCSSSTTQRQVVDAAVKQNPEALRGFLRFWEIYGDVWRCIHFSLSECIWIKCACQIFHLRSFKLVSCRPTLRRDPGFARGAAVAKLKVQQEAPTKLAWDGHSYAISLDMCIYILLSSPISISILYLIISNNI